ncbi:MAG: DUF1292 domain-containing protein [Clostridia bacterium]|nr:DUF1292 domain-containing protein [Clostridia bacterium]
MLDGADENIVYLEDENGEEVAFEFLDIVELDSEEYVVLLPVDDSEDGVVILKFDGEDGDTENYTGVEDDETLAKVFEIFKERFKDVFDFDE